MGGDLGRTQSLERFQDLALMVQMECRGRCALVLCGNYFLSVVSYEKNVSESLVSFIKMRANHIFLKKWFAKI